MPRGRPNLRGIRDGRTISPVTRLRASTLQQIRGNWSPTSMSTIRRPPNTVRMVTRPASPAWTRPMTAAHVPADASASPPARPLLRRRSDNDNLAFIGEVERIKTQNLAKGLDLFANRRCGLVDLYRNLRGIGDLVEDRRKAPRVGSRRKRMLGEAASSASISP